MKKLMEQLDLVLEGISKNVLESYLTTALWSSTDMDTDDPLDDNYSIRDIDKSAINDAKKDLAKFWKQAGDLLKGEDETQIAHDFWLTRNGHGAGFWDRKYDDPTKGDKLTKIAEKFGEINLYVGDDGKIYS